MDGPVENTVGRRRERLKLDVVSTLKSLCCGDSDKSKMLKVKNKFVLKYVLLMDVFEIQKKERCGLRKGFMKEAELDLGLTEGEYGELVL